MKNIACAYEPIPQALEYRVKHTLEQLDRMPKRSRGLTLRTAVIALVLALALCGVGYAIYESVTTNLFGWFYGADWQTELQNGDFAPMGQTHTLGDVTYTVEEMVYKTDGEFQGLYGVVRIAPAEGANVVLVADDFSANDPAGYLLHYANALETIEDDAPSYAELAAERGAKLLRVRAAVNSITVDGVEYCDCFGESWLPQKDGSVLGTIEISDELPRAPQYELSLWLSNRELTSDGYDLSDDTWLQENWSVTVSPESKEEHP